MLTKHALAPVAALLILSRCIFPNAKTAARPTNSAPVCCVHRAGMLACSKPLLRQPGNFMPCRGTPQQCMPDKGHAWRRCHWRPTGSGSGVAAGFPARDGAIASAAVRLRPDTAVGIMGVADAASFASSPESPPPGRGRDGKMGKASRRGRQA
eukprot:365573-Chlamydomonas_euryale.AAC.7